MPFNVLNLSTGELARDGDSPACFESPQYAAAYAADLTRLTGEKHQPRVVVSDDWQRRERERFNSGEYLPVAWQFAQFWLDAAPEVRLHFCHRSKDKPAFIAFTESPEKGARDIQTRLRPGVYLKRYFGEILSDAEITRYARLHSMLSGEAEYEIKFAKDAEHIQWVYENGPVSCMSLSADEYSSDCHPVRVYGDSDLQVAYIRAESDYHDRPIMARALVWPEKQVYGRVYPTPERYYDSARELAGAAKAALVSGLEAMGYTSGDFRGAKIQKIEDSGGGYVMPYLDGVQDVEERGEFFIITPHGSISATNTSGLVESGPICEHCEERYCEDDGYNVYISRHSTETWCSSCHHNDSYYCHGYEESYSTNVDSVEVEGETFSLYYARANFYRCDRTGDWNADGLTTVNMGEGRPPQEWCAEALEDDAFYCEGSNEYYNAARYTAVDIDGSTYEQTYAFLNGLLSKQGDETESETV